MSIITISRGSYSRGKEVAEKVAQALHYECISREVLLEASDKFHIPELKLVRAIHDAPSLLDRFSHGKEAYITHIRQVLFEHVCKDNVVYHGLAGHFFLQGIAHVLKVRIIADMDARVREEMKRENLSEEEALYILKKDDDERRKWGLALYGADPWDAALYDLVIHIRTMSVDDAVDLIVRTVKRPCFLMTPVSKRYLDDLVLASRIQVLLIESFPTVEVTVVDSAAFIAVKGSVKDETAIAQKVNQILGHIPAIKAINTSVTPTPTADSLKKTLKMLRFG